MNFDKYILFLLYKPKDFMKNIIDYINEAANKEFITPINHTLKDFFENPPKGSAKEIGNTKVDYKYGDGNKIIYHFYDDIHTLLQDMLEYYKDDENRGYGNDKETFCIPFSDCSLKISTCGYPLEQPKNPKRYKDPADHIRFFVLIYNTQKELVRNIDDYGKFEWREEFILPQKDATENKIIEVISDKINNSKIATKSVTDAYDIEFTGKRTLKGNWTSKVVKKECRGDISVKATPKNGGIWQIEINGEHKGYDHDIQMRFEVKTLSNIGRVIDWLVKPARYKKSSDIGPDGELYTHYNKQNKNVPKEIKDIFIGMC